MCVKSSDLWSQITSRNNFKKKCVPAIYRALNFMMTIK